MSLVCLVAAIGDAAMAQTSTHWSYQPLVRPEPPAGEVAWSNSALDRFVWTAMRGHGLSPSPAADRTTWLRRVAFDLTGLPPTPAEVAAFLADAEPAAEERVVDRLLQSPRSAERWTSWWLDLARYADSQGYEKDGLRLGMWRYRDWVLDAFSRDLPFDQFTIEQLAGDLLPDASVEQRLATSFHRQTMTNTEGGTDDEEFRVAAVIDRVDTTMSVWMGSTLGCAQCHDHKYDPFSQREFFELFAFFDQTADSDQPDDAPTLRSPTRRQQATMKALELELTELRSRLQVDADRFAAWREAQREGLRGFVAADVRGGAWRALGPIPADDLHAAHTTPFAPERDGVQLDTEQEGAAWRHVAYEDGRVHTWSGERSATYLQRTIEATAATTALLSLGSDDAIRVWWNGTEILAKEVARAAAADQELLTVDLRAGVNTLLLKISNGGGPGGFYCDLRATELGPALERVLLLPPAACDASEHELLQRGYLARAPELADVRSRIAAVEFEFDAQRGPQVPVLEELPVAKRRTTRLHRRGNFLDPQEVVEPATPRVWPSMPEDAPRNRLGFARWLVARDNPLTARVLANRIWSELFGVGLVATLEDFGSQGDAPTHPALLDWLAAEFIDHGWSLRALLRTIVLSATYAQSSAQSAAARAIDADNQWLARGPSFRLSAEMVRDQALSVAGQLVEQLGGPSVMPPQPDGIWMQIYSGDQWVNAEGGDRHRRALYTFWRRTSPHPAMLVFDAQSREACVLRRQRTNTPLQALVLWNDPQFHEAARALAHAALVQGDVDDEQRVRWLWRRCLLREPSGSEVARLLRLLRDEREHTSGQPNAGPPNGASPNPGPPNGRPPNGRPPNAEVAVWSTLASVVMNLDEFVTRP